MTAIEINALNKPCPMPLLLLKKSMKQNSAPQQYLLMASDPNSQTDIQRYCTLHNFTCKLTQISASEFHYMIES